jgi:ABC-type Fe3+ transport system permease subunit
MEEEIKMEPLLVVETVLCAVSGVVVLYYRYLVSADTKARNRQRYNEWIHSDRRSAKLFRGFWWFLIFCTALNVLVSLFKALGEKGTGN